MPGAWTFVAVVSEQTESRDPANVCMWVLRVADDLHRGVKAASVGLSRLVLAHLCENEEFDGNASVRHMQPGGKTIGNSLWLTHVVTNARKTPVAESFFAYVSRRVNPPGGN